MTAVLAAVRSGVLEVREDGTVWRVMERKKYGPTIPVTPRRAETINTHGYYMVRWTHKPSIYLVGAHRLVWTCFFGAIPKGFEINHMDGVKTNNAPSNLEPVTRSQNIQHAYDIGLIPSVQSRVRGEVLRLRLAGHSYEEIGRLASCGASTAHRIVNNVRRSGSR